MSNHNLIQDLIAKRTALLGEATPAKDLKGRKSVKAQRKAAEAADMSEVKENREVIREAWSLPVAFVTWQRMIGETTQFRGYNAALDAGRGDLVVAHKRYVNVQFDMPIVLTEIGGYGKLVKRQMAWERTDKRNLGLLGYSAEDIVQLGVVSAWSQLVERWLKQTGASYEVYDLIGRAIRDRRTNEQLMSDARLGERTRYVVSGVLDATYATGAPVLKLRKESQSAEVRKARQYLAARRLFRMYPCFEYLSDMMPSVGSVYREVHKVFRDGLREFHNTLEGLTPDGVISDATTFVARNREDLVAEGHTQAVNTLDRSLVRESVESTLFERHSFAEAWVERRGVMTILRESLVESDKHDLLPSEVDAYIALDGLMNGMTLLELRQVFEDKTEREFGQVIRDMAELVAMARKSDDYDILADAVEVGEVSPDDLEA